MAKFGIGQSIRRVEDPRLLTGGGRYTDDTRLEAPARAYVLRSPHAHADIKRIDVSAAAKAPACWWSSPARTSRKPAMATCPAWCRSTTATARRAATPRPMLAQGRVRHVGDPVAWSWPRRWTGQGRRRLIEVDYEARPTSSAPTGRAARRAAGP